MGATIRVPFEFTLIDKRHQPFVDGRRGALVTFLHMVFENGAVLTAAPFIAALFIFFLGASSLVHDRGTQWGEAGAKVTGVTAVQRWGREEWRYDYTFIARDGGAAHGQVAADSNDVFTFGQKIPVTYAIGDPADNHFAGEPLSRDLRDWMFIGASLLALAASGLRIVRISREFAEMRRLSQGGRPRPGSVINAFWSQDGDEPSLEIHYQFAAPNGSVFRASSHIPPGCVAVDRLPEPGVPVAVWCSSQSRESMLL